MTRPPTLEIAVRGPAVGAGRMAIDDLAFIARCFERALVRIAEAKLRPEAGRRRRKARVVEEQCRLFLVGWRSGSAVATFELGRGGDLFSECAESALRAAIEALDALGAPSADRGPPAPPLRSALDELLPLGPLLRYGIERIAFRGSDGAVRSAVFDRRIAEAIAKPAREAPAPRLVLVHGRLERLDGHGRLAGTVWEADGTAWTCRFPAELEPELGRLWRRWVEVEGRASQDRRRRLVLAEEIRPAEDRPAPSLLELLDRLEPIAEELAPIEDLPPAPVEL